MVRIWKAQMRGKSKAGQSRPFSLSVNCAISSRTSIPSRSGCGPYQEAALLLSLCLPLETAQRDLQPVPAVPDPPMSGRIGK
jgi:hypothetical protein